MDVAEGSFGRVFVVRFEHGESVIDGLESLARDKNIRVAAIQIVGALDNGKLVVGPLERAMPPVPIHKSFNEPHEVVGNGTLAWENETPIVHIHGALGRNEKTLVGCTRTGVNTYLVIEAVVMEILGTASVRKFDEESQFSLLNPNG